MSRQDVRKDARRRNRTKARRKGIAGIMITFWLTLLLVLLAGGAALFAWKLSRTHSQVENITDVVKALTEPIPEGDRNKAGSVDAASPQWKYSDLLSDPERMEAERVFAPEASEPGQVTLAFAGDILFDDNYSVMVRIKQRAEGIRDSLSPELLGEMQDADILMLNNEFPYSSRGTPAEGKQFTFRARPEYASMLTEMGVDIVSLANNHAYDYGGDAMLDTLDTLEGLNMPYVGAGRNLEEAVRPVYFILNDIKIAFLSATQIERLDNPDTKAATDTSAGVFRCWNPERLLEEVAKAKENSDFVVVYIHWGTENVAEPDWAQLDQAPRIAEAGADLIIGDHPHCLQGIDYYGNTPVIYSVGNFLFNSKTVDTCLMKAVIDKDGLKSFQFLPALQQDCSVSLLSGAERERVLSYMRGLSPKVTIDSEGYVDLK